MPERNHRPVFLDLTRIRMPVNAVVSILHRLTGILLFLSIPYAVYLLDLSLRDEQGYDRARVLLDGLPARLLALLVLWAFAHHLIAGLRFLLLDLHIGVERGEFQRHARAVMVLSGLALLLLGGAILT